MHFLNNPNEQQLLKDLCQEHDIPYDLAVSLLNEAKNFDPFTFKAKENFLNSIANHIEASLTPEQKAQDEGEHVGQRFTRTDSV